MFFSLNFSLNNNSSTRPLKTWYQLQFYLSFPPLASETLLSICGWSTPLKVSSLQNNNKFLKQLLYTIIQLLNTNKHHIWQKVSAKFWLVKSYGQSLWSPRQGANKCWEVDAEPWPGGAGDKEVISPSTTKVFYKQLVPRERCEVMN